MLCLTCLGEGSQAAVGSELAADCMQAEVSACSPQTRLMDAPVVAQGVRTKQCFVSPVWGRALKRRWAQNWRRTACKQNGQHAALSRNQWMRL